jgi:hypothetical protein
VIKEGVLHKWLLPLATAVGLVGACRSPTLAAGEHPGPAPSAVPPSRDAASVSASEAPDDADDRQRRDAGGSLAPLAGSPFETWHLGDVEVVASLPLGAREPRPVVVGVHGSHERPDTACARWRRTLGGWAFVVCPKGVPWRGGLAWGSPAVLAQRIDVALAALHDRYGAYVATGPVVYAGWSLGGTCGPKVVAARPGVFEPVILAEVGHTHLDAWASAAALRKGRDAHVIVACATGRCAAFTKRLDRATAGAPTLTAVDAGIGRGHIFDERMARSIGAALVQTVAGDPRWTGLGAALEGDADVGNDASAPVPDLDENEEER